MLPDPVPGEDGHYLPFESVYGTTTSEKDRPSLSQTKKRKKTLPFIASIQHAKNTNLMVECVVCGMWHLIYSRKKLSTFVRKELEKIMSNFDFSSGFNLSDLDLPDSCLADVHCRDLACGDPVEKLYYSMGYENICIFCSCDDDIIIPDSCYPICGSCAATKQPITKTK